MSFLVNLMSGLSFMIGPDSEAIVLSPGFGNGLYSTPCPVKLLLIRPIALNKSLCQALRQILYERVSSDFMSRNATARLH